MGFFDFLKRKDGRHDFTDADRRESADNRAIKADITRLKHENSMALEKLQFEKRKIELELQLKELQSDLSEFDDEYDMNENDDTSLADKLLMTLLSGIMAKQQPGQGMGAVPVNVRPIEEMNIPPMTGEISDQELRAIWAKLPKAYQNQARAMVKR